MVRKFLILIASAGASLAASSIQAQTVTSYSGDAYVIRTNEDSMAPVFGDTGSLPAGGGTLTNSLGPFRDYTGTTNLTAGNSATSGAAGVAISSATITGFSFNDSNTYGFGNVISFDSVITTSKANVGGVSGSVVFTNLVVNGMPEPSTLAPNTVIPLKYNNATLTINKQTNSSVADHNELTVQALDIYSSGAYEVNAAVVNSDVSFTTATPDPGALALFATSGLGAVSLMLRRRRRK